MIMAFSCPECKSPRDWREIARNDDQSLLQVKCMCGYVFDVPEHMKIFSVTARHIIDLWPAYDGMGDSSDNSNV